jgi:PAS domain S-box-containing protein
LKDIKQTISYRIAYQSPLRLLLLLGCSIFGAELFSHLIIHGLLPDLEWVEGLGDSTLLLVMLFPSIYFLMFRPLNIYFDERLQTEQELRERERHYRTLFSQAMDGILLLDMEGNIVSVNESFARMHGYSLDELLAMNLRDLDTPETLAQGPEWLAQIRAGESIEFEVEHFHKDGHIVPLHVTSSAINVDDKSLILAFHHDITERRLAFQELKRSHEDLRDLSRAASEALEAERRRTARELHDELGGELTALKMDVMWIKERLPAGQQALEKKLTKMQAILDSTTKATRRISTNLRPMILDDLGLIPSVEWLVENFREHSGVDCELLIADPSINLMDPYATAVFRILQEALTNVTKHAQASLVEISISRMAGEVRLNVRDNGRGFTSTDPRKPDSYGLIGLRERARLLNGEIRIDSAPGRGTIISLRIPIVEWEVEYQDYSV